MKFTIKELFVVIAAAITPFFFFVGALIYFGDAAVFKLFLNLNFLLALGIGFAGIVPAYFVGKIFLQHPLLDVIRGKGILSLDLNGTGVSCFYVAKLIKGKIGIKTKAGFFRNIFDRTIAFYLKNTQKAFAVDNEGDITIKIPKKEYDKARLSLESQPMLLINTITGTFTTKDEIGKSENDIRTQNISLQALEETKALRKEYWELSRKFMDDLQGNKFLEFFKSPVVKAIIVIMVIAMLAIFVGPIILDAASGMAQSGGGLPNIPVTAV